MGLQTAQAALSVISVIFVRDMTSSSSSSAVKSLAVPSDSERYILRDTIILSVERQLVGGLVLWM
jgi:hypothetical protein